MIPLEMRFLGWEFSVVRSALTVLAAIGMGVLFDRLMPVDGALTDSDIEPLGAPRTAEETT